MFKKTFLSTVLINLLILSILIEPAYCYKAIMLSDAELDHIYVGGFEFNINAAYAFRSAVIDQNNLAAISSYNKGFVSNVTINAANRAMIQNEGDSALSRQNNISAIFAKAGDIINANVNNINFADVKNTFNEAPQNGQQDEGAIENALVFPLISEEPGAETAIETSQGTLSFETPLGDISIDNISAQARAIIEQTNIAAVVAANGNIVNTKINNLNQANIDNQGFSGLAVQTNIALIIAKGIVENADVLNSNFSNVTNIQIAANGNIQAVAPSAGNITSAQFKNTFVSCETTANSRNITFITSLGENIKNNLLRELANNKFVNHR